MFKSRVDSATNKLNYNKINRRFNFVDHLIQIVKCDISRQLIAKRYKTNFIPSIITFTIVLGISKRKIILQVVYVSIISYYSIPSISVTSKILLGSNYTQSLYYPINYSPFLITLTSRIMKAFSDSQWCSLDTGDKIKVDYSGDKFGVGIILHVRFFT